MKVNWRAARSPNLNGGTVKEPLLPALRGYCSAQNQTANHALGSLGMGSRLWHALETGRRPIKAFVLWLGKPNEPNVASPNLKSTRKEQSVLGAFLLWASIGPWET